MKVTKEKAAEHRAAIVEAASRLFRERGFDGVGVAEITKAAGLTHGGFYGHFPSKDALAEEASRHAFAESAARFDADDEATIPIDALLDRYLSESHRDRPATGCPMAALAGGLGRQGEALQAVFSERVERFVGRVAERLPAGAAGDPAERHARALTLTSALVGSMVLARATADSAPEFSTRLLESVRKELGSLVAPADPG